MTAQEREIIKQDQLKKKKQRELELEYEKKKASHNVHKVDV